MTTPIGLRAAEPTFDDGRLYARYLEFATEGLFRVLLGRGYANVIARAFHDPNHDLSYENATFATSGGEVVGLLSAYPGDRAAHFSDEPLIDAAGIRLLRLITLAAVARPLTNFMKRLPETDFYVQALAVDPSLRGQGVGTLMLREAETRAKDNASARLALDVSVDNLGGIRLYERFGMTTESTSPKSWLGANWRVHRMVKDL